MSTPTPPAGMDDAEFTARDRADFTAQLVAAGHLLPTGAPGVVGHGADFEAVVEGLSRALRAQIPADDQVSRVRFPPVGPQAVFEGTDYVTSFPQLIGALRVFTGGRAEHEALLAERREGADWTGHLVGSGLMMVSAGCHPIYGRLAGRTLSGALRYDTVGQSFRHEPSDDPARLVAFRMHEQVLVGDAEAAERHRDVWLSRMTDLLRSLGLDIEVDVANDPFFGRPGKLLAAGQRAEALKYELLAPVTGTTRTAIASGNAHRDHFGLNFDITLPDGSPAHSACFGLGLERTTLALLRRHGLDVSTWPSDVRATLALSS